MLNQMERLVKYNGAKNRIGQILLYITRIPERKCHKGCICISNSKEILQGRVLTIFIPMRYHIPTEIMEGIW